MRIVYIHGHMIHHRTWRRVADELRQDGIDLVLQPQWQAEKYLAETTESPPEVVLCDLYRDLPGFEAVLAMVSGVPLRVGLGPEVPASFSNLSPADMVNLKAYLHDLSAVNYRQGMRFLSGLAGGNISCAPPLPVRTHGIFHPDALRHFDSTADYMNWYRKNRGIGVAGNLVGLILYHSQLAEANAPEVEALIRSLESHGLAPLAIFSEGLLDSSLSLPERYPWLAYLRQAGPRLCALVNLMAGRFLSQPDEAGLLESLDVPVFQGLRLHGRSRTDWLGDPQGIPAHSLIYAVAQPEMAGAIEPTLLATDDPGPDGGERSFQAVPERVDLLGRRIKRWLNLRDLSNEKKRVTVVLHNNPCKGAEATVGMAVGLDALESLGRFVAKLRAAGYDVGEAPETGREILSLIQERKAHGEFRWTTVDEIARKGGDLRRVTAEQYLPYFASLPQEVQDKMVADWGEFPGQGMVFQEAGEPCLLITGLGFGNLKIMVQPKRGCYGPKCTGEVCRILHDPALSPPHHWLATYKYIQDTSDVVIHFGAEGALEYLPGKRAALSGACYPDISLGDLPNVYVYAMDIPGEGLMAKRRGRAVIVDHLAPVYRPVGLGAEAARLEDSLAQYRHARDMGEAPRAELLRREIIPLLRRLKLAPEDYQGQDFTERAELAERQLAALKKALAPEGMHVLGQAPDHRQSATLLAWLLKKGERPLPSLEALAERLSAPTSDPFNDACTVLEEKLAQDNVCDGAHLGPWLKDLAGKLSQTGREIDQVLKALDGLYLQPNLGGSLIMGQSQALPSGRNFYALDLLRLPTPVAWQMGRQLADELLRKYLRDEGRFPQTVGVSLWSSDAFKSQGELLCQVLHLMGARPVWEPNGRVRRVEAIALEELALEREGRTESRPRVDVVVQTSGILRDMVPGFIDLIDQAAVMLGELDEPPESNSIRRHTQERLAELGAEMNASDSSLKRLASFRVFSSAPGAYGLGVELALDASAWETTDDLAEVYVNWGGFAYGTGGAAYGTEAHDLLAKNLKDLDVSYMRQFSPEYDVMDCGGYAAFQGGMAVAAKGVGAKGPRCYFGGAAGGEEVCVSDLKEALETALRSKLLNPVWLEHMKKHGHQGAEGVSSRVNNMFKWSATTGQVEQRLFEAVADFYLHDQENLAWLRQTNPYALEELTRRMLEADSRGLWQARPQDLSALHSAVLAVEGDLEEAMGQVDSEFQGARVEVLTARQVDKWQPKWSLKSRVS